VSPTIQSYNSLQFNKSSSIIKDTSKLSNTKVSPGTAVSIVGVGNEVSANVNAGKLTDVMNQFVFGRLSTENLYPEGGNRFKLVGWFNVLTGIFQ
jgi:hypothetical protein